MVILDALIANCDAPRGTRDDTSHALRSWSNELALQNIADISVTDEVFHAPRGALNEPVCEI